MLKLYSRLLALALVPCLLADPALAFLVAPQRSSAGDVRPFLETEALASVAAVEAINPFSARPRVAYVRDVLNLSVTGMVRMIISSSLLTAGAVLAVGYLYISGDMNLWTYGPALAGVGVILAGGCELAIVLWVRRQARRMVELGSYKKVVTSRERDEEVFSPGLSLDAHGATDMAHDFIQGQSLRAYNRDPQSPDWSENATPMRLDPVMNNELKAFDRRQRQDPAKIRFAKIRVLGTHQLDELSPWVKRTPRRGTLLLVTKDPNGHYILNVNAGWLIPDPQGTPESNRRRQLLFRRALERELLFTRLAGHTLRSQMRGQEAMPSRLTAVIRWMVEFATNWALVGLVYTVDGLSEDDELLSHVIKMNDVDHRMMYGRDLYHALHVPEKAPDRYVQVAHIKLHNLRAINNLGRDLKIGHTLGAALVEETGPRLEKYLRKQLVGQGVEVHVYSDNSPVFNVILTGRHLESVQPELHRIANELADPGSEFRQGLVDDVCLGLYRRLPEDLYKKVIRQVRTALMPEIVNLYGGFSSVVKATPIQHFGIAPNHAEDRMDQEALRAAKFAQLMLSPEGQVFFSQESNFRLPTLVQSDTVHKAVEYALLSRTARKSGFEFSSSRNENLIRRHVQLKFLSGHYNTAQPSPSELYAQALELLPKRDAFLQAAGSLKDHLEAKRAFVDALIEHRMRPREYLQDAINEIVRHPPTDNLAFTMPMGGGDEFVGVMWKARAQELTVIVGDVDNARTARYEKGYVVTNRVVQNCRRALESFLNGEKEQTHSAASMASGLKRALDDHITDGVEEKDSMLVINFPVVTDDRVYGDYEKAYFVDPQSHDIYSVSLFELPDTTNGPRRQPIPASAFHLETEFAHDEQESTIPEAFYEKSNDQVKVVGKTILRITPAEFAALESRVMLFNGVPVVTHDAVPLHATFGMSQFTLGELNKFNGWKDHNVAIAFLAAADARSSMAKDKTKLYQLLHEGQLPPAEAIDSGAPLIDQAQLEGLPLWAHENPLRRFIGRAVIRRARVYRPPERQVRPQVQDRALARAA